MNIKHFDEAIEQAANPKLAKTRLQDLLNNPTAGSVIERLDNHQHLGVIKLLGFSNLFYRLITFRPELLESVHSTSPPSASLHDLEQIKRAKYQALFNIAVRDCLAEEAYTTILQELTQVAEKTIQATLELVTDESQIAHGCCSMIALGKLGARELNFSSDVDLIFTYDADHQCSEETIHKVIRKLVQLLHDVSENGFLYRVDLNLRPWGKTGPLALSIEDSEHYYEMTSEPLERFIWLRARCIAGDEKSGQTLIDNLKPFVYRSSLSSEDLERFIAIKQAMKEAHNKKGCWNVKQGTGGIRDIEFFVQLLQITNGSRHPSLRQTNTIQVLNELTTLDLLKQELSEPLKQAYLFLRRLENHLQMIDEQQTHHLPQDSENRLLLARSMGFVQASDWENLQQFESTLAQHRKLASECFEDLLPTVNNVKCL